MEYTRHIVLVLAATLLLAACGCVKKTVDLPAPDIPSETPATPTEPPAAPQEITYTLMTYNVGAFSKYKETLGHYSFEEVAAVIRSVGSRVVGLNETDWGAKRSDALHQAEVMATTLGKDWGFHFYPAAYTWYGNSMVWNQSLDVQQEFTQLELPKTDGSEVRSMGAVEFKDFVYCVTHLDHRSETDRLNAVALITDWVATRYAASGKPVFLVGDMNAEPRSSTIKAFEESWTQLSGIEFSFSTKNLSKCIDYIFVYNNGAEKRVRVLQQGIVTPKKFAAVGDASDHCPVWVTVKWLAENND